MEKNPKKGTIITIIGILFLGAMLGSLVGELIKLAVPDGVVKEVFLRSVDLMVGPGVLDLLMFSITIGFTIKFNFIGLLGIIAAYYLLRFWR